MDHREQTEATRATLERFFDRYHEQDFEGMGALIDEDVDWALEAPQNFLPFAGPRRGRVEVIDTLKSLVGGMDLLRHEAEWIIADGEFACAYIRCEVCDRETGKTHNPALCDVVRVRDGKVVWFREFFDSLAAFQAMMGMA